MADKRPERISVSVIAGQSTVNARTHGRLKFPVKSSLKVVGREFGESYLRKNGKAFTFSKDSIFDGYILNSQIFAFRIAVVSAAKICGIFPKSLSANFFRLDLSDLASAMSSRQNFQHKVDVMLTSLSKFFVTVAFAATLCIVSGCGDAGDQVMEQTADTQAQVEAYNEQMDKPSPGI